MFTSRKYLLVLLFCITCFVHAIAQTDFYYYMGTKIPLTLNENKVCVSIPTECNLARERIFSNVQPLDTIRDEEFETRVISRSDYEKLTSMDFWEEDSKSVIVTSCYFTERNDEVYTDPYINVRLKKEEDIDVLNSCVEQYKLRIVENDRFMPLWYIISLTLESEKSPLECANELWETGYFAASVPDLVSLSDLTDIRNAASAKECFSVGKYDLLGRPVNGMQKGILIRNGKKVLVK